MKGLQRKQALAALIGLSVTACGPSVDRADSRAQTAQLSLPALLESLEGEFTPLGDVPALSFPADHGAHPAYRTEAWVLSGLIGRGSIRVSALQVTIFRIGLGGEPDLESNWATGDVFAAAAMLADGPGNGVQVAERISRAAAGLAGTTAEPASIWVEDWRFDLTVRKPGEISLVGSIAIEDLQIEFEASSAAPVVTPAELDRDGGAGAAPFAYYAQPMLDGTVTFGEPADDGPAAADFVFEHAWGELPLPGSPVARDRFTLFLADGRELTLLRTHRTDGGGAPETQGLLIAADGRVQPLESEAVELEATDYWQSPQSGARYPVAWRLSIASVDLDASLRPVRRDFEAVVWAPVWMGVVDLVSSSESIGQGTMILNGYEAASN